MQNDKSVSLEKTGRILAQLITKMKAVTIAFTPRHHLQRRQQLRVSVREDRRGHVDVLGWNGLLASAGTILGEQRR